MDCRKAIFDHNMGLAKADFGINSMWTNPFRLFYGNLFGEMHAAENRIRFCFEKSRESGHEIRVDFHSTYFSVPVVKALAS